MLLLYEQERGPPQEVIASRGAMQVDQALMTRTRTVKNEDRVSLDVEKHGYWCAMINKPQAGSLNSSRRSLAMLENFHLDLVYAMQKTQVLT